MPGEPYTPFPHRNLEAYADPDTEIIYREVPDAIGPHVEQYHERDLCAIPYARSAYEADQEGDFDAVMIGCFAEPGMRAARELCDILVMSAACATLHVASMLSNKFSIVKGNLGHGGTLFMDNLKRYGLESKLASLRMLDCPPTGMNERLLSKENLKKMHETALEEAKAAIEEDGAELIIGYSGTYSYLKEHLEVPVLSPGICTLKMTEAIVRMGLTHSKIAFAKPRPPHTYYLSRKPPT